MVTSVGTHYILSADKKYDISLDGVDMLSTKDVVVSGYVRKDTMSIKQVDDSALAYIILHLVVQANLKVCNLHEATLLHL